MNETMGKGKSSGSSHNNGSSKNTSRSSRASPTSKVKSRPASSGETVYKVVIGDEKHGFWSVDSPNAVEYKPGIKTLGKPGKPLGAFENEIDAENYVRKMGSYYDDPLHVFEAKAIIDEKFDPEKELDLWGTSRSSEGTVYAKSLMLKNEIPLQSSRKSSRNTIE